MIAHESMQAIDVKSSVGIVYVYEKKADRLQAELVYFWEDLFCKMNL